MGMLSISETECIDVNSRLTVVERADRQRFELDDAQWQVFQCVLERLVQHKSRLDGLLHEPGLLG